LWRATELNPAVFGPGATTGNTPARRVLSLANAVEGQKYGTIGQVDDTGRANYHGMLLSVQRRGGKRLSACLSNWTVSRCMSDPADDRDHRTDRSSTRTIPISTTPTARRIAGTWSTCRRRADAGVHQLHDACAVRRLAVLAARAVAERESLERDDRRRPRVLTGYGSAKRAGQVLR
jgi:hypothetical protein